MLGGLADVERVLRSASAPAKVAPALDCAVAHGATAENDATQKREARRRRKD